MRIIKSIALLIICSLSLCSCSEMIDFFKKDAISISPSEVTISAADQTFIFDIKASEGFTVKSTGKWISLDSYTGNRETEHITASLSGNIEASSRIDTLIFVCGKVTSKVVVKQEGMESIISKSEFTLEESYSFTLEAYDHWQISTTDTKAAPDWFEVSPVSGEAGHVEVSVKSLHDNIYGQDRNAFIKVTIGSTSFYVTVTQKKVDAILESKDKIEIPTEGGKFSFDIKANMKYRLEYPENTSWLSPVTEETSTKAVSTSTEYFTVEPNGNYDSREASIIIIGEVTNDTLKVFQAQKDALILNQKQVSEKFPATSFTVELRTNVEYSTTILQEGDWVKIVSQQALRTDQATIQLSENTTDNPRNAKIIFKDINSILSDTLYIYQGSANSFPFIEERDYGIYCDLGYGESATYTKYIDQLSISEGSLRIQNVIAKSFVSFTGIPANLKKGDLFTLECYQNSNSNIKANMSVPVTVVKTEDSLVWLYNLDEELGFIINK